MEIEVTRENVRLTLDAGNTYEWAHREGKRWPCSTLSGHEVWAEFDSGGLVDYTIDCNYPDPETGELCIDGREFSAMTSDFMRPHVDKDHSCWYVNIGQFLSRAEI